MAKRTSSFNPSTVLPPKAPRQSQEITQIGRTRVDAYAWMKYIPPSGSRTLDGLPPALHTHLQSEMAYATEVLRPLHADIQWFLDRLTDHAPTSSAPPRPGIAANSWRYTSEMPTGESHRIFSRHPAQGQAQPLLDEAERARGHAYYRATDHQASPDDHYFAWAEDLVGNDRHRICVLDMMTGDIRTLVESDAYGYGGFVFSPSSQSVFWIWRDAHSRPTRLYRTSIECGDTTLIYPVSYMPAGTKAPMVWYGGENIAASGGKLNGMISFTEVADRFEVEGVARQDKTGLLVSPAVKSSFDVLKQRIKGQ
ncbi:hypothetical protein [Castellaniella sp.]|uniref:hypothetical protein n=1 Tax=Castellaniella sp. TaxID=1955812 RepID=UPI003A9153FF